MYRRVLGLDIGSYSLKAVVAKGGLGRLEVQRFVEQPLIETDSPERTTQLARTISLFRQDHGLTGMDTVCAFPGQMASTRRLNLPFADPKKIRQTVPFEVESQVPYDIEDVVIDYQVLEKKPAGTEILVGLAQRESLSRFLETLELSGVDPRILEFDATALANLAPFLEDADGFTFLVDIGHAKTCLCGLREGRLHSVRTIPVAGRALTTALMEDFGTAAGEAERRKHAAGMDLLGSSAPSFSRTLDRLAKEIDRTLTAPENTGIGRPDRIILFGGSARMRGLRDYIQERLGVPASSPALKRDERFTWNPSPEALMILPQALGLALRGVLSGTVSRLNLRREEFVYRRDFEIVRRKFMPTFTILMVLILLLVTNVVANTVKNRSIAAELDRRIETVFRETHPGVNRIVDPLAQMRFRLGEMRRRTEALGLYGGNVTALDIFREISMKVPANLDVTLNLMSIDEGRIRLQGSTQSFELVERLETALETIPFFSEVNVGDVKADRGGGKSFNVTITMGTSAGSPATSRASGGNGGGKGA